MQPKIQCPNVCKLGGIQCGGGGMLGSREPVPSMRQLRREFGFMRVLMYMTTDQQNMNR